MREHRQCLVEAAFWRISVSFNIAKLSTESIMLITSLEIDLSHSNETSTESPHHRHRSALLGTVFRCLCTSLHRIVGIWAIRLTTIARSFQHRCRCNTTDWRLHLNDACRQNGTSLSHLTVSLQHVDGLSRVQRLHPLRERHSVKF